MNLTSMLLAATLALPFSLAVAQTLPPPGQAALSGTTAGLSWSIYAGGLTRAALLEDSPRLRIGVPQGAGVLGSRYDGPQQTLLLTYRLSGGLDARSALSFAANQLQLQGFDLSGRSFPEASSARATLNRDDQTIELQVARRGNGDLQVTYRFGRAAP